MKIRYIISKKYNLKDFNQFLEFSDDILSKKENKKIFIRSLAVNIFNVSFLFINTFIFIFFLFYFYNNKISREIYWIVCSSLGSLSILHFTFFIMNSYLKYGIYLYGTRLGPTNIGRVIPINRYDLNYIIYILCTNVRKKSIKDYNEIFNLTNENITERELLDFKYHFHKIYNKYTGKLSKRKVEQIFEECLLIQNVLYSLECFSIIEKDINDKCKPYKHLNSSTKIFYLIGSAIMDIMIISIITFAILFFIIGYIWLQ